MLSKPSGRTGPNRIRISHLNSRPPGQRTETKTTPDLFGRPEIELYFLSLHTIMRTCHFGSIKNHQVHLNPTGQAVQDCWYDLPVLYPNIHLDLCVVMPNHLHGILVLHKLPLKNIFLEKTELGENPGVTADIDEIIQKFIDISSKYIYEFNAALQGPVWKKPLEHEQIKNETRLNLLREYIADNPSSWKDDPMNPKYKPDTLGVSITNKHPAP
ncbi:hypothetical protein K8S19_06550 [bacterium]|nr:hypothetical protein [bacterium]